MHELDLLMGGFATLASNPLALLLALVGVALGIVIGAQPGLTATMGVAILTLLLALVKRWRAHRMETHRPVLR